MASIYWSSLAIAAGILVTSPNTARAEDADAPDVQVQASESWACSSETMAAALETAKARLVRIDDRFSSQLGFVFHDRRHVLTPFSGVFWNQGVRVRFPDGRESTARIVAHDGDSDLAILEIDHLAKATPMRMGPPARVGDPVFAVTRDGYDLSGGEPSIHAGVVNSQTDKNLRTDALKDSGWRAGAPILDCAGRLVAMARRDYDTEAIPIALASALAEDIGQQPVWEGPVVRPEFEAGLLVDADRYSAGFGAALGMNLVGREGWEVKFRAGALALQDYDGRPGARIFGHTGAGYRFTFDDEYGVALGVTGGLVVDWDQFCSLEGCLDEASKTSQWRVMPSLELSLYVWPGVLSYQHQFDVEDPQRSLNQILIGVAF